MNFNPADLFSLILFSVFSLGMLIICVFSLRFSQRWKLWTHLFVALTSAFSLAALSGLTSNFFLPLAPILLAFSFAFAFFFTLSSDGRALSLSLPITWLIGFQSFRFPLELILHHWADLGTIPTTMTWTGQNWDVATGVLSLISIPFVKNSKRLAFIVNLVGFFLLINVLRVVLFSLPLPFAWPLENPIRLIEFFPYCLIAPLFVVPALVGHLLTFQKFWLEKT